MNQHNETAVQIGRIIQDARIKSGYTSRASLVETRKLRGKITGEGLRKIEHGERIPRLENIRLLSEALGLKEENIHKLETLALQENVKRVTRRAGNAPVTVKIDGKPVRVTPTPPKRKAERFTRQCVEHLVKIVDLYGVMDADLDHFRRHARSVILQQIDDAV